jgi:hypothetical protein
MRVRLTQETAEGTAAGVYGVIVSSAVLVTAHAETAVATDLIVLVTLAVYWAAERYARIVAERIHEGHRPNRQAIRAQLTSGWEIISASLLPLLVLLLVSLLGAGLNAAALAALACSTGLLCLAGWRMGADGRLTLGERVASTLVAGAFGAAMVALKVLLH